MEIIQVSSTLNLQKCLDIRRRVFIEEQKVPEEHELAAGIKVLEENFLKKQFLFAKRRV